MATSCAHVAGATALRLPSASTSIYKDECTLCFVSPSSPGGLDVCLSCFNGACSETHSELHYKRTGHAIALNLVRRQQPAETKDSVPPPPAKMTKLMIPAEPAHQDSEEDFIATLKCLACPSTLTTQVDGASLIAKICKAMLSSLSAAKKAEIKAWEEETVPCSHTKELVQQTNNTAAGVRDTSACTDCGLQENLWLCLTCGNLGCGRQQFGGTGGHGHGLKHFESTGNTHPVAVKLGTITPDGTADVFCYLCGEERIDENLGAHLAHFGIQIDAQKKTEKSLGELQLEQNLKFDFSMTTEDGKSLMPLSGPGFTGLKNLGNTCYMASVCQVLFSIVHMKEKYIALAKDHPSVCQEAPATCYFCQMGKLVSGLESGSSSKLTYNDDGSIKGQEGIAPTMFKELVGRGHPEFSSMRQQDAQEFLTHLLSLMEQKERVIGTDPSSIFKFKLEEKLTCLQCQKARCRNQETISLMLPVPAKSSGNTLENGKPEYLPVSFDQILKGYFGGETREFQCPHDNSKTFSDVKLGFFTYPDILICSLSRFVLGPGWVMEKLNVAVDVPEELDLSQYLGEGLKGEEELPEGNTQEAPIVDEGDLQQLMAMGFPEIRCRNAILKTGNNGAEVAMNWLFEHMDDPDIDNPPTTSATQGSAVYSPADLSQLMDMGFTQQQAKKALNETSHNVERAVDWLFSHADSMMDDNVATNAAPSDVKDSTPAKYRLFAFISHKGTSAQCGHYVAFVLKQGKWTIYNDNKVAEVTNIQDFKGEGYVYFYERIR